MSTGEEAPVGRIENLHFARLLARMWERGFTGSFRAHAAARPGVTVIKEILFERGRVAWAASDDPEESIRVHLINRGILQPDQWKLAEEKAGSAQARQTLLDLGFLNARELQEADRERVTAIVLSLFTWREGRYESAAGSLPHGTPNLKIDPRDLVLEGLMSSGDRGRVLDEIGSLEARLVVRPDDLVRASLSLPVELVGLMGKADGTRTIADVCALSPLSDFLISATFAGLKVLGLARPLEGAATVAPPAPPTPAPDKPPVRRRAGKTAFGDASESEAPSRLPLGDDHETIPMMATPPGGTPSISAVEVAPAPIHTSRAALIEGEGHEAMPIKPVVEEPEESTPTPAASRPTPPALESAAAAAGERARRILSAPTPGPATPGPSVLAAPALQPAPSSSESTAFMATPPARFDLTPSPIVVEEGSMDEDERFDREAEVELKPGIPVITTSDRLEHTGAVDLRAEEIEDVIDVLDAPFPEEDEEAALQTGDEAPASGDDDLRSLVSGEGDEEEFVDDGEAIGEPEETIEDEGIEEGGDADDLDQDAGEPPWVYQPSEETAGPARSRRWATVGAVAVAVIGLAAGILFIFGTGGSPESRSRDDALAAESEVPDVLAPAAFTPPAPDARASVKESASSSLSPASFGEKPLVPPPGASRESSIGSADPRRPQEKPSRTRPPRSSRPLASPPAGSIFSSGSWKAGRRLLENGSYEEAARRFESAVSGRAGLYTVQLALACEPQTIARALRTTTSASEFFILPTTYQGRSCYRLLWGAYSGKSAAIAAKGSVPRSFQQDPNPPKVAPI